MARDISVRRPRTNQFAIEPNVRIGRSVFNRSHGLKMTFKASYLYPILVDEVLPGDTFTCSLNGVSRIFSPLDAPLMDNIELETFFFFVPNRLVWEHWEDFMGSHDGAGYQDTVYTVPKLSVAASDYDAAITTGAHMGHYMGIPQDADPDDNDMMALPFRAYNLIYNEFFRDQNLIDEVEVPVDDGPDAVGSYALRKSAKRHDYFTSALPYLQKGAATSVPLAGDAPVLGIGVLSQTVDASGSTTLYESDDGSRQISDRWLSSSANIAIEADAPSGAYPQIFADLSAVSGVSINTLRESVAIQRMLEKDARGGTRYEPIIKSHFGVTSPDYRLQRPEFLGGGKAYINVSPVANTADQDSSVTASGSDVYQGELRGIGAGTITGHGWAKSFVEHGIIIGLIRARGDLTYWQGLDRMWSRQARTDFYFPELANLGEQSILNKEIYVSGDSNDDVVFGYQERWAEYRYKQSRLVGLFNPDVTAPISFWHLAEDFSSLPSLNQTFIEDQTPMSRVVSVSGATSFLLDLWFNYRCARPIPVHSIPSLLGGRF